MGRIYNNIVETVGRTPLVKLNKVTAGVDATILLKCEFFNPLSSVKDRIGMSMIEDAEKRGVLKKDMPIQLSNLKYVCPSCNASARLGARFLEDGSKERFCKKCGASAGEIAPAKKAHAHAAATTTKKPAKAKATSKK